MFFSLFLIHKIRQCGIGLISVNTLSQEFSLCSYILTGSGAILVSYLMRIGARFLELSGQNMKLTSHLHVVQRPRMCRALVPCLL
jgi:hypothetical protein